MKKILLITTISILSFTSIYSCSNNKTDNNVNVIIESSNNDTTSIDSICDTQESETEIDYFTTENIKAICNLWKKNLGAETPLPNEVTLFDIDVDGISEIIVRNYDDEVYAAGIFSYKDETLKWLDGICDDCGGRQYLSITDKGFIIMTIEASISSSSYYRKIKNSVEEVSYLHNVEYDRWSDVDEESLEESDNESDLAYYEKTINGKTTAITAKEFNAATDGIGKPIELIYSNDETFTWQEFVSK